DMLAKELKQVAKEKDKYAEMVEAFNDEREKRLDKEVRKASEKINEMIQESTAKNIFRRHENLEKIKFDLPNVIKASSSTAGLRKGGAQGSDSGSADAVSSAEDFEKYFPAGSTVHITTVGRDGIVQGRPNAKGEVPVLSSSMRMTVHWQY